MEERLKMIRSFYGLSQAQFAQKIRMSPGFISNVETGRSKVSEKTVDAICKEFPVDRRWLLTGEGEMFVEIEHNPIDKEGVASRVRILRKQKGLTQEEFGKRIGYSKMQVYSVEKGKVIPSNQFLEKVAYEFEINEEWIFTGSGVMEDNEAKKGSGRGLDEQLVSWLKKHPEIIKELRKRSGLD